MSEPIPDDVQSEIKRALEFCEDEKRYFGDGE
jgi:hypothetical protein